MSNLVLLDMTKTQNKKTEGKNHAKYESKLDFFSGNGNYNFGINSNLKRGKIMNEQILDAYESLSRDYRYSQYLNDMLQKLMVKVLDGTFYVKEKYRNKFYLMAICNHLIKDEKKQVIRFQILKQNNLDNIDSMDNGITLEYISEVIEVIEQKLKGSNRQIFRLYNIFGMSQSEIAIELNISQKTVSNKLQSITSTISKTKIKHFFDGRYVRPTCKKKREKIKWPIAKGNPSDGITLTIAEYKEVKGKEVNRKEVIPSNKCLSYGTKQYFKVSSNDTNQIADMGINSKKSEYLIDSNTYGNAKVLPLTSKEVNEKEVIDW